MLLPNRDNAYVASAKITGYLLSETHSVGQSKAKFFRRLGFNETNTAFLEQELLNVARSGEITATETSVHGTKFVIPGAITTPNNTRVTILTVWIIDTGAEAPRFVTARPLKPAKELPHD